MWPILFDDNIGRLDSACGAHIVDVRDVASGKPVPFDLALRRHIVRAEPFLALGRGTLTSDVRSKGNYFLVEVMRRLV